ncbi:hypothetical protein JXA88_11105 [Candidatus Fermentibacteria bacterium]|nr:hypothetical protein [Candidatus Fermentibacteria bacterium]
MRRWVTVCTLSPTIYWILTPGFWILDSGYCPASLHFENREAIHHSIHPYFLLVEYSSAGIS